MDIRAYNREAWNRAVDGGENRWTQPVSAEVIARARNGDFSIVLTENKPVPRNWFPPLNNSNILCLASGGGQQGPVLAAAGAKVTVLDNSPRQLEQDRAVAEREGLRMELIEGDAADLSRFADETFDLVFNPCSTVFMADVRAVWREAARVLKHGGALLTGSMNPIFYIFDLQKADQGILEVVHSIPYADLTSLSGEDLAQVMEKGLPLEFGHSLTDLLGGQLEAGFVITALYEDAMNDSPVSKYHPVFIATRAVRI